MPSTIKQQLPSFRQLLIESWQQYRAHWPTLILLALINIALFIIPGFFLYYFEKFSLILIAIVALSTIILLAVTLWYEISVILIAKADNKKLNIQKLTRLAIPLMGAFLWLTLLSLMISFGGLLLFIVPGILLIVFFSFAPYVLINEKVSGLEALDRSVQYFKVLPWENFGRIVQFGLSVTILFGLITLIIESFAGSPAEIGMFNPFNSPNETWQYFSSQKNSVSDYVINPLGVFVGQLSTIFIYKLYLASKELKGAPDPLTPRRKRFYIFLAVGMPIITTVIGLLIAWAMSKS